MSNKPAVSAHAVIKIVAGVVGAVVIAMDIARDAPVGWTYLLYPAYLMLLGATDIATTSRKDKDQL